MGVIWFHMWAKLFMLGRDVYQPHARSICITIMPCHEWWWENYLLPAVNDNEVIR